jgi:hypothetical protein
MANYRACFLNDDGQVLDETTFRALSRNEAIEIAERLAEKATADCSGYEVWRGETKVAHRGVRGASPD